MTAERNTPSTGFLPESMALLRSLEKETGPLSDALRALLVTDGSVTRLLECFSGSPISIHTLTQVVIDADDEIAREMQIAPGDPVNYREVGIYDKITDTPLIHAVSYCPVNRLPVHARHQLMQADIPIGHILKDEKIESRREITEIRTVKQPAPIQNQMHWPVHPGRLFSRTYRIIHQNLPLFRIEEFIPDDIFSGTERVIIQTPSRLHLTLIDMNGSLGRVDGGIGITLDEPGYVISAKPSDKTVISTDDDTLKTRTETIIASLAEQHNYDPGIAIQISESIPSHRGLGSGTQLALAVASAMSILSGKNDSDLPSQTGRGGTSGIGVRAFADGGVIIDGGHRFGPGQEKESFLPSSAAKGVKKPPLIGRFDFPDNWRIVLCLPNSVPGANGKEEKDIFRRECPVPLPEVEKISHLILMQMIPALIEEDLDQFGRSVTALRSLGFKRKEMDLQPPFIHDILDEMVSCGAAGAGMSSFGPALYAVTDTNGAALAGDIQSCLNERCGGEVRVVRGRNTGAAIKRAR